MLNAGLQGPALTSNTLPSGIRHRELVGCLPADHAWGQSGRGSRSSKTASLEHHPLGIIGLGRSPCTRGRTHKPVKEKRKFCGVDKVKCDLEGLGKNSPVRSGRTMRNPPAKAVLRVCMERLGAKTTHNAKPVGVTPSTTLVLQQQRDAL